MRHRVEPLSPVERHLRQLGRSLWLVPQRRRTLLREARDHLLEAVEQGREQGLSRTEAEFAAVARFGSTSRVVSREVREAGPMWAAIVAGIAALSVTLMVTAGHGASAVMLPDTFDYQMQAVQFPDAPVSSLLRYYNQLTPRALSASSRNDAWLVGLPHVMRWRSPDHRWYSTSEVDATWHWDGLRWSVMPTARVSGHPQLSGIVSMANDEAWAVGWRATVADRVVVTQPLIERWDGHSWSVTPQPEVDQGLLFAVAASAQDNVWAVGYKMRPNGNYEQPLIERWDGRVWHVVQVPWRQNGAQPDQVAVTSPTDVWVVDRAAQATKTVRIEHWNGDTWASVRAPFGAIAPISGFAATSGTDAWAVGGYQNKFGYSRTLAAHWDGHQWQIAPTPNRGIESSLSSVVAHSSTDAWAIGGSMDGPTSSPDVRPLQSLPDGYSAYNLFFLHWDGLRWTVQAAERGLPAPNEPRIAIAADGSAFAVGSCPLGTIAASWNGTRWQPTDTPQRRFSFFSPLIPTQPCRN